MVIFPSFFSKVMFLISAQIVRLKWCKVAKIAFPRYLSRVISSLNTYVLLETMINQIGFICAKFLQIRFVNVSQFHNLTGLMKYIVLQSLDFVHIYTMKQLYSLRKKMHCIVSSFLISMSNNAMCHKSVEITLINILLFTSFIIPFIVFIWNIPSFWWCLYWKYT